MQDSCRWSGDLSSILIKLLVPIKSSSGRDQFQWWIQHFPKGGGINPRGGAPKYYLTKLLPQAASKWKKLDRGSSLAPLINSLTLLVLHWTLVSLLFWELNSSSGLFMVLFQYSCTDPISHCPVWFPGSGGWSWFTSRVALLHPEPLFPRNNEAISRTIYTW